MVRKIVYFLFHPHSSHWFRQFQMGVTLNEHKMQTCCFIAEENRWHCHSVIFGYTKKKEEKKQNKTKRSLMRQTNPIHIEASKNVINRIYRTCTSFDLKIKSTRSIHSHACRIEWASCSSAWKWTNKKIVIILFRTTTMRYKKNKTNVVILRLANTQQLTWFSLKRFFIEKTLNNTTYDKTTTTTMNELHAAPPFIRLDFIIL